PDEDDPVDRVGPRHERGVERGRDLADDLEADEHREHEHRQRRDEHVAHEAAFSGAFSEAGSARGAAGLSGVSGSFGLSSFLVAAWTTWPSWVMTAPAVISSSKSSASSPSLMRCSKSALTLRAYMRLALVGIELGRFRGAVTMTPLSVSIVSPGFDSAQLPPCSPARSTTTAPGRIALTASSSTRMGARRPGTSAVVMITSASAMKPFSSSRWARCSSSVSARA